MDFGPNLGPGLLQLDSGRGDVEFVGVFASVASLAGSFVAESIFRFFYTTYNYTI